MAFIVTGGYWQDQGYWETYSNPQFDAGARTVAEFSSDGFFTFSVEQATGIVCGLNTLDGGASETEILYGFYLESGRVRIVERGIFKTAFVSYTPVTSVFRVERINGRVRYYKDGTLLYTSSVLSTGTVFLDCSLYAAGDTILGGSLEEYAQLHITLPYPEVFFEEALRLEISLSKPQLILLENDGGQLLFDVPILELIFDDAPDLFFSLPIPTLDLIADEDLTVTLSSPQLILWSEDESLLYIEVPKPALVLKERAITPDVSLLQFSIQHPRITLNEEENLSLDLLIPPPIIGLSDGYEYCHIELPHPLLGMTPAIMNFGILEWPQWNFTLIGGDSLSTLAWALHTVSSGGTSCVFLHRTSYQGSDRQEAILLHETSVSGMEGQALHATTYQSGSRTHAQAVHEAIYGTFGLAPTLAAHATIWSSASRAPSLSVHQAHWASTGFSTQLALHDALWSSRILTSVHTLHSSIWASIRRDFITSLNDVSWSSVGSLSTQFTVHTSEWSTAVGRTQQIALHDALWSSRILTPSLNLHESTWTSGGLQVTMASHQVDWSSVGANVPSLNLHQASWASSGTSSFVLSTHDTSWSVRPTLLHAHEQCWKSIVETSMLHHSAYETVDNTFALQIHRLLWRSNQTSPIINTGIIYARI